MRSDWFKVIPLVLSAFLTVMPANAQENGADKKLAQAFKSWLDESIALQPFLGTRLGDHRHAGKLEDLSPQGRKKVADHTRKTLEIVEKEFNTANLSPDGRVDWATWKNGLERSLWVDENLVPLETDPRSYNEYSTDSTYLLVTQTTLPRQAVINACLSRMAQVPRVLEQAKQNLAPESSRKPIKVFVETAIRQVSGSIAWYKSGLIESLGQGGEVAEIQRVSTSLVPLFESYKKFLEQDVLPRSSDQWRVGPQRFAKKLELDLEADITALEVLAEAEGEFTRVESEMAALSRNLWPSLFQGKVQLPDTPEGRRQTSQKVIAAVSKDRGTVSSLVRDEKGTTQAARA